MFQSKFKNPDLTFKLNIVFFLLLTFYTFVFTNLYFFSTFGADYQKYISYLQHFFGMIENTNLEQGPIYFYFVSLILSLRAKFISPILLQSEISFAIQLTNLLIILIGFVGFYFLLREYKIDKNKILIIFHLTNFFPPLIALKITMKPEVLVFALLPWFLYLIKIFIVTKNKNYLLISIFPAVLILTTKGSWLGMLSLYGLIITFTVFKNLNLKLIIQLLIAFSIMFGFVLYENQKINQYSVLDFQITDNYDNAAELNIIYKNDIGGKQNFYVFEFDKASLIGVTLLDTFSDQFNFYWDKDVSVFNNYRKELIVEDKNVEFMKLDTKNRYLKYNGPFSQALTSLRGILGIILTFLFYASIVFNIYKSKKYRVYLISPFIGMFILLINSMGFPLNNFDPKVGDTFKTFYYSPFIILSFIFLIASLTIRKKVLNVSFIVLYLLCSIFIFGFPKKDSVEYYVDLGNRNEHSVLCEVNKIVIYDLDFESNCSDKHIEFCKFQNNRSDFTILVEDTFQLEASRFIIQRMLFEIDDEKILDKSCYDQQSTRGLIDVSKTPLINLLIFISIFGLIYFQRKKDIMV